MYKKTKAKLKEFNFLQHPTAIMRYLKNNKDLIIKNINYAFFEDDSEDILVVFSSVSVKYVYINTRLSKNYPAMFENQNEYENYLAIYGTFAILLNQNFKAQNLQDSRILIKDYLKNLTHIIYYDESFRLNLSTYTDKNELKAVYRYGYDFCYCLMKSLYNNNIKKSLVQELLQLNPQEIDLLLNAFVAKIIINGDD